MMGSEGRSSEVRAGAETMKGFRLQPCSLWFTWLGFTFYTIWDYLPLPANTPSLPRGGTCAVGWARPHLSLTRRHFYSPV